MHPHSLGIRGCVHLQKAMKRGSWFTPGHMWLASQSRTLWDTVCTFSLAQQGRAMGPKQLEGNIQRHRATACLQGFITRLFNLGLTVAVRHCQHCWLTGFRVQLGEKTKLIFQISPNLGWCKTEIQERAKGSCGQECGMEERTNHCRWKEGAWLYAMSWDSLPPQLPNLVPPQHPEGW